MLLCVAFVESIHSLISLDWYTFVFSANGASFTSNCCYLLIATVSHISNRLNSAGERKPPSCVGQPIQTQPVKRRTFSHVLHSGDSADLLFSTFHLWKLHDWPECWLNAFVFNVYAFVIKCLLHICLKLHSLVWRCALAFTILHSQSVAVYTSEQMKAFK